MVFAKNTYVLDISNDIYQIFHETRCNNKLHERKLEEQALKKNKAKEGKLTTTKPVPYTLSERRDKVDGKRKRQSLSASNEEAIQLENRAFSKVLLAVHKRAKD